MLWRMTVQRVGNKKVSVVLVVIVYELGGTGMVLRHKV